VIAFLRRAAFFLLLGLCAKSTAQAVTEAVADAMQDPLRVALITAAPGALYWERFGHNAILIEDRRDGSRRLYNFGWFDFQQENFMLNFVRGRMLYRLAVSDPDYDIAGYREDGRSVWLQELDLDATQKRALADLLNQHAQPGHDEYRYDYYLNNCSTKVRDALDSVLGGQLKAASVARGRGETYRSLSLAYAREIPWLAVGIHLGLGPAADRRINFWEEAFLPLRLRDLVAEAQIRDGESGTRPLAPQQRLVVDAARADQVPAPPQWFWIFLIIGLASSAVLEKGLRSMRPGLRALAAGTGAAISLLLGLIGLGLLGLWLGTDHQIAWRNANLWLFSPLCLLLAWPVWRLRNADSVIFAGARHLAALVLVVALLALVAGLLKLNTQAQSAWLALLLPWHLAFWHRLSAHAALSR
jgi:hypothetical protein